MKISKSLGAFIAALSGVEAVTLKCQQMQIGCKAHYSIKAGANCDKYLSDYKSIVETQRKGDRCNAADGFSDYLFQNSIPDDQSCSPQCEVILEFIAYRVHKYDEIVTDPKQSSCENSYYSNRICGVYRDTSGSDSPLISSYKSETKIRDVHCAHY